MGTNKVKFIEARGIKKYLGLMFRTRKTNPLIFNFDSDVDYSLHSLFVFFDFEILFVDSENKIIERRIIKPFTWKIKCKKPYRKIIEIPILQKRF